MYFVRFIIEFSMKSFGARKLLSLRGLLCFLVVKISFWQRSKLTSAFPQSQVYYFHLILYVCEICLCRRLSECPALCCTHAILHQTRFNPLKRNSWACSITMQYRQSQGLNGTVELTIQYYNAIHGDCLVLHSLFKIQLHAVLKTNQKREYIYQTSGNLYNFLLKLLLHSPIAQSGHALKDCHSHKIRF